MAANLVKFISCTAAQYATAAKDDNALYFLTDTGSLYKGSVAYSGGRVISVATLPETGATPGALYVSNKGEVSFAANANTLVPVVVPAEDITETDNGFTTGAQVYAYVSEAIQGIIDDNLATETARIEAVEKSIETLNGSGDGSVQKTAEAAAKAAVDNVLDGAPAAYDTLKEIAEYIASDQEGAAAMTASIKQNADDIDALELLVGDTAVATQITTAIEGLDVAKVGEAGKYVSAVAQEDGKVSVELTELPDYSTTYDAYGAADAVKTAVIGTSADTEAADTIYGAKAKAANLNTAMDTRVSALETAVGAGGSVEKQITDALDALDHDMTAVEGYYVSKVTQSDGQIATTTAQLPVRSVTESTENGQILVNGANVAVHGLGSAAFEDKTAFDAAGEAAQALTDAKTYADKKVASVTAADASIVIGGETTAPTAKVNISQAAGNALELADDGLKVTVPAATDYTVTVAETNPEGVSKRYTVAQAATGLNVDIDIPLDMVVSAGAVEDKDAAGDWGEAGTYLVLTLANATKDKVYINVGNLIEYVTSGSSADDQIQIAISEDHKVTATLAKPVEKSQLATDVQTSLNKADSALQEIADGSVTKAKLSETVQASLDAADSAVQKDQVTTGVNDGTIKVQGTEVAVAGLKSAAFVETTSLATAAQGAKADSALQTSSITTGSANGTIAVEGTDVAVKGLGSAAYEDADTFASATDLAEVVAALTWQTL